MVTMLACLVGRLGPLETVLAWLRTQAGRCTSSTDSDVAIAIYATIGVVYGVMLALIVVAAWTDYEDAKAAAFRESAALIDLIRLADGFRGNGRKRILFTLYKYAAIVQRHEWPKLELGFHPLDERKRSLDRLCRTQEIERRGNKILAQLYLDYTVGLGSDLSGSAILSASLEELDELGDVRRARFDSACSHLPRLMWIALSVGMMLLFVFAFVFEVTHDWAYGLQVLMLLTLLGLLVYVVWVWDHPFGKFAQIDASGFDDALQLAKESFRANPPPTVG